MMRIFITFEIEKVVSLCKSNLQLIAFFPTTWAKRRRKARRGEEDLIYHHNVNVNVNV